jgi:DNA-binding NarL/FixJ family response regulator
MLRLISDGNTMKQAAVLLEISVRTAECHRASVMDKLDIHDTAGLVRYAVRQGLVVA